MEDRITAVESREKELEKMLAEPDIIGDKNRYLSLLNEFNEVKEELEENTQLINEDPYGKEWIFKIKPDTRDERKNLMIGAGEIREWLKKEIVEHGGK